MNYCDFLFNTQEDWLSNLALLDVETGRRYTYLELQTSVCTFSNHLRRKGYRPGDVIATHLYNSAEAVIAHLAIQYSGCVSCLLDPLIPAQSLSYYMKDSQARCLLTHLQPHLLENQVAGNLSDDLDILETSEIARLSDQRDKSQQDTDCYEFEPDALAVIFYTSGTTNQPKGVMLPTRSFLSHFRIFTKGCYTYVTEDRLLCFVPFSHGYGSKSIFLPCIHAGAAMVIMRSFQPMKIAQIVQNEAITHIFGVPSHYQQLLRRDEFIVPMRKLKAAFSAAELLKLETAQSWFEKVGFFLDEGYGLIETCTGVAFRLGSLPRRLGHVGSYSKDLVSIEVVDDDFTFLPPEERGEIVVRGESVMIGYLNKPEETAKALHHGWFRTGDMGYKTTDNQIVLVGRIKDVINVAGIKVAPSEIEGILNQHPSVQESAVVGVENEMYGEVVKAFVKTTSNNIVDERELIRFLQKKLMSFQVPKEIVFIDEFPRNNMGKIDRKALRNL
jgi:long-chain acyl-CoA synthetase